MRIFNHIVVTISISGPFLQYIAKTVPTIQINTSRSGFLTDKSIQYWKLFAQNLLRDGVERVRILGIGNPIVFYRQQWLEFADQFMTYLNELFFLINS